MFPLDKQMLNLWENSKLYVESYMDKHVISQIHTFMTILLFLPGGQFGEKECATNFPVQMFTIQMITRKSLPRNINDCNVFTVTFDDAPCKIGPHSTVKINEILYWLSANNKCFSNIIICLENT